MNNLISPALVLTGATPRRPYVAPAFVQELVLETRAGSPNPNFQDGFKEEVVDPILGLPPTPQP